MRSQMIGKTRVRHEFHIRVPNRVLSINDHDKLSHFGFEIYGAIDAFSRYIIRCYVGISNRTAAFQLIRSILDFYGRPYICLNSSGQTKVKLVSYSKFDNILYIHFNQILIHHL